jgi:hypothetical protein
MQQQIFPLLMLHIILSGKLKWQNKPTQVCLYQNKPKKSTTWIWKFGKENCATLYYKTKIRTEPSMQQENIPPSNAAYQFNEKTQIRK